MKTIKLTVPVTYAIFIILTAAFLISCGKDNKTTENKEKKENKDKKETVDSSKNTKDQPPVTSSVGGSPGKQLFYMKSVSNNIACADCHSDGTNSANPMTKYFSNIQGADKRAFTYNGLFTGEEVMKTAGGATVCWENYERMKTPLSEDQIKSLNEYYASVAANAPANLKYETIALPKRDKSKLKDVQKVIGDLKGDPSKGEATFTNACGSCHGESPTVKKVPGILEDFDGNVKSIIYNVRLGDGAMPFFHNPQLTDQDVADISAYVMQKNGK